MTHPSRLAALLLLAACVQAPADPPGHLVIRMRVSGFVTEPDRVLSHAADDRHRCTRPVRLRLPSATGPAPRADQPASDVAGYGVTFGPDFPSGTDFSDRGPFPGAAFDGPQQRFTLELFAAPGQEATSGPIRLGRRLRITVSAGGGVYARTVEETDAPHAGFVALDPDMRGGRFLLRDLERQLHHNRAPENEVISISGTWRCPEPG